MNYRPAAAVPRRRRWQALLVVLIVIAATLFIPFPSITRQTRSRIDVVTGSIEWQTTWPLGITTGPKLDVSPIEQRLTNDGVTWRRDWRFLHNTQRALLGRIVAYECGTAPPIYQLLPALKEFAAVSTDAELREFAAIMQSGTDGRRRAAVDAAVEKAFSAAQPH